MRILIKNSNELENKFRENSFLKSGMSDVSTATDIFRTWLLIHSMFHSNSDPEMKNRKHIRALVIWSDSGKNEFTSNIKGNRALSC